MSAVVDQSGSTVAQVSPSGGSLSGTLHIVTTDGAGPYKGMTSLPTIDRNLWLTQISYGWLYRYWSILQRNGSRCGHTSSRKERQYLSRWPSPSQHLATVRPHGNTKTCGQRQQGLCKDSKNVPTLKAKKANKLLQPFKVAIPAGTTCTGTVGTMSNVCLVKLANSNPAGPFGGVFAMQVAGSSAASNSSAA